MADETYTLPEEPAYQEAIRRLQNTDPVDAEEVLNPLIQSLVGNTEFVRRLAMAIAEQNAADHTAIRRETAQSISEAVDAIPTPDVSGQIGTHDADASAHETRFQALASSKQDAFSVGPGLQLTEQTSEEEPHRILSAKTPIRFVTREEYDALSDEDKQADVLYIVDDFEGIDSGSGGSGVLLADFVISHSDGGQTEVACDKTFQELCDAFTDKKPVMARISVIDGGNEQGVFYTSAISAIDHAGAFPPQCFIFYFESTRAVGMPGEIEYPESGDIFTNVFGQEGGA